MAKFKFVGNPNKANEGPEEMEAHGHKFIKGKETEVPEVTDADKEVVRRLTSNNHFERTDSGRTGKVYGASEPHQDQKPELKNPDPPKYQDKDQRNRDPNNEAPKGMDHPRSPAPGRP